MFESCVYSRNKLPELKKWMEKLIQNKVSTTSLLHLDFGCSNLSKLQAAIRLVIVSLRRIFLYREESVGEWKEKVRNHLSNDLHLKKVWPTTAP